MLRMSNDASVLRGCCWGALRQLEVFIGITALPGSAQKKAEDEETGALGRQSAEHQVLV